MAYHTCSSVELLEERLALSITNPLSIDGTTFAAFFDDDGDLVTVQIAGSTGTVNFFDAANNPVDNGDDIASVVITGASQNFTLTFGVDIFGAGGVALGDITSDRTIHGIYSVKDGGTNGNFTLSSFKGVNFSAGGGLFVDTIIGDVSNLGVQLTGGLHKEAIIAVRSLLQADFVIGDSAKDKINGRLAINGSSGLNDDFLFTGSVGSTFVWNQSASFFGTATFNGPFAGDVQIDGSANNAWFFNKGVASSSLIVADSMQIVSVVGNFGGTLMAESGNISLSVQGNLTSTARLSADGGITVGVTGSVLRGALAASDDTLSFSAGGNFSGNFNSGSAMLGSVTKSITKAVLTSEATTSLAVGSSLRGSVIQAGNGLTLDLVGSMIGSTIASPSSGANILSVNDSISKSQIHGATTATIGGGISGSRLTSSGAEAISLTLGTLTTGNFSNNQLEAANTVLIDTPTSIINSKISSTGSDITLNTGANLLRSQVTSADQAISLNITGNALDNTFLTDDTQTTWTVGGNYRNTFLTGSGDLTLTVGGSILKGSSFLQSDTLIINVTGNLESRITANSLDLAVGGSVGPTTRIVAQSIVDGGDGGLSGFSVGGNFSGQLTTRNFDPSGDATPGQTHLLVGGTVTKTAVIHLNDVAGVSSDDTYQFGGAFLGRLVVSTDLDVDLAFGGNVTSIQIGGSVLGSISVTGKIARIVAGSSLFLETTPGLTGEFIDAIGTVTGNLVTTTGFTTVLPRV